MRFCSSCQIVHSFVVLLSLLIEIKIQYCKFSRCWKRLCVWARLKAVAGNRGEDGMQLLTAGGV